MIISSSRGRALFVRCIAITVVLGGTRAAEAHHGRDFLLARTAEVPHPGQSFLAPTQDAVGRDGTTSIDLEPSAIFGAGERVALEIHGHLPRNDASGFHFESTAPAVHLRVTPETSRWGVGASLEYEVNHEAGASNRVEGRVAVSHHTAERQIAVNIFAGHGGVDDAAGVRRRAVDWNYAAGVRRSFRGRIDLGVEASGQLSRTGEHELVAGIYTQPSDRVTINVGAGAGMGPDAARFVIRTAVVLRVR